MKAAKEQILLEDEKEEKALLYNAETEQIVYLEIQKGDKIYEVSHTLKPLSNERYFQLEKEQAEAAKRADRLSTELYDPKHILWKELVIKREGYAENPNWKEKTHQGDAIQAINTLLSADIAEAKSAADGALLNDEDVTPIRLKSLFNGQFVETIHYFREEQKEEFDQYLAIITNQPQKNKLASAKKRTPAESLYELYKAVCVSAEGYEAVIPAWHSVTACRAFFDGQFNRLGKF